MKTYNFKVVVEPDEDADGKPAWHAYCPALESLGAATSGRTKEEALKNVNEVVQMIVREFLEEGRAFPEGPADDVEVAEVSPERPRIAALGRDGFYFVRQAGSHQRYAHPDGRRVTVAPHGSGYFYSQDAEVYAGASSPLD